jgi:hypothetical protein
MGRQVDGELLTFHQVALKQSAATESTPRSFGEGGYCAFERR